MLIGIVLNPILVMVMVVEILGVNVIVKFVHAIEGREEEDRKGRTFKISSKYK